MTSIDVTRVATASRSTLSVTAVRHVSPRLDPRSGEGARIHGGRFNPPSSFPVLYLCETRPCAVAELQRLGQRHVVGVTGLLPRLLYAFDLKLERVLDLTDDVVREHVGITRADLVADDWATCQELGTEVHAAGDQAVRTFSATGVDHVLAVFPELVGLGLRDVRLVEEWDEPTQL